MSHVDEGTLHAYLDGELPSADRKTVEAHLAQCDTCRAALTEARALVERASAVLGAARPAERPAPSFEQLRRTAKRAPWHVRTSFAWAASIALALGVGYLLRNPTEAFVSADRQEQATKPATVAEPTTVATNQEPIPAVSERKAVARVQTRGARPTAPARTDEDSRAREKAAPSNVAASADAERSAAPAPAPAPAVARLLNDSGMRDSLRRQRQVEQLEGVVVTAQGAPARAAQDRAPTAEANIIVDGAAIHPSIAKAWPAVDREMAKSVLGDEPVGLPALPVRSFRRGPGLDGTIVVEQRLDASTVIQIFQRPASNTARSELRGYAKTVLLARYVGRLRVEIAAPVSLDSLNRLLDQVRPLP